MNRSAASSRDIGGMVVAALLILLGVAMLWDTTQMLDSDSYVFPRAVIGIMIVLCLVVIVRGLLGEPAVPAEATDVSVTRRVALVAAMLAGTLAMPFIGFAPAGLLVFGALMLIAMYERWTRFRLIVYPLVAVAITLGFFALFKKVFLVPLPEGMLF